MTSFRGRKSQCLKLISALHFVQYVTYCSFIFSLLMLPWLKNCCVQYSSIIHRRSEFSFFLGGRGGVPPYTQRSGLFLMLTTQDFTISVTRTAQFAASTTYLGQFHYTAYEYPEHGLSCNLGYPMIQKVGISQYTRIL